MVLQACHAKNVARKKRSKFREKDPRISLHSIRATISKYMTSAGDALGYCVPGDALPGGKRGVGGGAVPKYMQGAIHPRIAPINSSIRRNNDCALRGLSSHLASYNPTMKMGARSTRPHFRATATEVDQDKRSRKSRRGGTNTAVWIAQAESPSRDPVTT